MKWPERWQNNWSNFTMTILTASKTKNTINITAQPPGAPDFVSCEIFVFPKLKLTSNKIRKLNLMTYQKVYMKSISRTRKHAGISVLDQVSITWKRTKEILIINILGFIITIICFYGKVYWNISINLFFISIRNITL